MGMQQVWAVALMSVLHHATPSTSGRLHKLSREQTSNSVANSSRGIITGDMSLVYGYRLETKPQHWQWNSLQSPRPNKAHQVRSATERPPRHLSEDIWHKLSELLCDGIMTTWSLKVPWKKRKVCWPHRHNCYSLQALLPGFDSLRHLPLPQN